MRITAYKPIITRIDAFDATIGTTITFGWKGAQAFQNELIIRDSETLDIVYKYKTGRDMSLKHVMNIALGTTNEDVTGQFKNGKQYQATITVFDKDGVQSDPSDPVTFWCFTEPVLKITNEDVLSGIITMSSLYLNFYYQQTEGETLSEYYIELYDENRYLLLRSSIYYGSSSEEYLEYRIEGLLNNHTYYVNVNARTAHGIEVSTGLVQFSVKHDKMGAGALISLKDLGNGNVSIGSNFKIVDANSNPEEPIYINDEEIDLRNPDSYVNFFDGFEVSGDYEMKMKMRAVQDWFYVLCKNEDEEVLKITYKYYDIDFEEETKRKYYFKLHIFNDVQDLNVFTKMFDKPTDDQELTLVLRHYRGYYALNLKIGNATVNTALPFKLRSLDDTIIFNDQNLADVDGSTDNIETQNEQLKSLSFPSSYNTMEMEMEVKSLSSDSATNEELKIDYKNDILDESMIGRRKYKLINNEDGTISIVDETSYTQRGDFLSAEDLNKINESINNIKIIDDEEIISLFNEANSVENDEE